MKQESRKQSREKTRQKKKKYRSQNAQKSNQPLTQTIDDYTIQLSQVIGEGTYGKVFKTLKLNSSQQFACKVIKKEKIENLQIYYKDKRMAQQLQKRLKTEGEFQQQLSNCPYIAKMYKTHKNQKGFYFIMEYCESDLSRLLKKQGFLVESVALKYFKQIVEGIKFIYDRNAFHRDLKPENLLIKNDTIKISDFGFVKIFSDIQKQSKSRKNRFQTQSKVGTFRYMSPSILALLLIQANCSKQDGQVKDGTVKSIASSQSIQMSKKYSPEKSDVWSLGIILYKMLYGKQPYDGKSFQDMIKKISEKKLDFPATIEFPPGKIAKTNISKGLIKLIKKMLVQDEQQRIDFLKLYSKLNSLFEQSQTHKNGLQEKEKQVKNKQVKQVSRTKKEQILSIYSKLIIQTYSDMSSYATLRELGIAKYCQHSYKLIALLHDRRKMFIKQPIEKSILTTQIQVFQSTFYEQIKKISKLDQSDTLETVLIQVYEGLVAYNDFQLFIRDVQMFLLGLMQILGLEMGVLSQDYVAAMEDKAQQLKAKSILNFKNDIIKLINDQLKNVNTQKKQTKSTSQSKQKSSKKQQNSPNQQVGKKQIRQKLKSHQKRDKSKKQKK